MVSRRGEGIFVADGVVAAVWYLTVMGVDLNDVKDGCWLFGVASARPARAYPALLSVLWASLARAPFVLRKGRRAPPALALPEVGV